MGGADRHKRARVALTSNATPNDDRDIDMDDDSDRGSTQQSVQSLPVTGSDVAASLSALQRLVAEKKAITAVCFS
jgi:hypothetical protein